MTPNELETHIKECENRLNEAYWNWDGSNGLKLEMEAILNGLKDLLERENVHPLDVAIIMLQMSENMGKTRGEIA